MHACRSEQLNAFISATCGQSCETTKCVQRRAKTLGEISACAFNIVIEMEASESEQWFDEAPSSLPAAMRSSHAEGWRHDVQDEMNSHKEHQTWTRCSELKINPKTLKKGFGCYLVVVSSLIALKAFGLMVASNRI